MIWCLSSSPQNTAKGNYGQSKEAKFLYELRCRITELPETFPLSVQINCFKPPLLTLQHLQSIYLGGRKRSLITPILRAKAVNQGFHQQSILEEVSLCLEKLWVQTQQHLPDPDCLVSCVHLSGQLDLPPCPALPCPGSMAHCKVRTSQGNRKRSQNPTGLAIWEGG